MPLDRALNDVIVGDSANPASLTLTPGVALRSAPTARVAGIVCTTSLFSTTSRRALCTSTTGVSPVTVIDSSRPPTFISIGMVSVCEPESSMPARRTVAKPGSVVVRV